MTATQSIDIDELARLSTPAEKCPLVRGQYSIVPPGAQKAELYQRVSNCIKVLEDRFRLERHQERQVALGLAARNDLLARVASCRPTDKDDLDALCADAKEAAKASARANYGTAVHAFCERVDLGEITVDDVPAVWRPDVAAYVAAREAAGIEIIEVEQYVVHHGIKVAGKRDRVVSLGSLPSVMDLKTGDDLSWSAGAISMQLALYANPDSIYDPKTKKHSPAPEVDRDHALVFHLPFGQGRCDIYTVDIKEGWEAVTHALWVKQWRNRCKGLLDLWGSGANDHPDVRRTRLAARVVDLVEAGHGGALVGAWPDGVAYFKAVHEGRAPAHTAAELDLIAMAISAVENTVGAPFAAPDRADR